MSEQQPLLLSQDEDYDAEASHVTEESIKRKSYRETVAEIIESQALHKTIITLVIIDSACVLTDLGYAFLTETCTPSEEGPGWLTVLAHISLAITTFFLVEIPITLWASGLQHFNPLGRVPHATLHLFDAIVIVTTFTLEVILSGRERELASLLIILRLWRLVKLVQGIAVSAGELEEGEARELETTRERLAEMTTALKEAREETQKLRARLTSMENGDDGDTDESTL